MRVEAFNTSPRTRACLHAGSEKYLKNKKTDGEDAIEEKAMWIKKERGEWGIRFDGADQGIPRLFDIHKDILEVAMLSQ